MDYLKLITLFCPLINRLCQGIGCMAYSGTEENGICVSFPQRPVGNGLIQIDQADAPAAATETANA